MLGDGSLVENAARFRNFSGAGGAVCDATGFTSYFDINSRHYFSFMVIQMIRICKGEFVFPDPQAAASCLMIVDPDTAALIPAGESGGTKEQRVPQESGRKPVGGEWIFGRRRFVDAFPGLRNPLIRRPSPFAWTGSAGGSQEKEPPGFSNTLAASTRGSQEDIVFLFHFEEGDPSQQAFAPGSHPVMAGRDGRAGGTGGRRIG